MSTDRHPTKASLRELEPLFADAAGRERAAVRHSTLRLQPTVLPPPPDDDGASTPQGASPEDDLDLGLEADEFARRRQLLLAAAGVATAIAGTVAYLLLGPSNAPNPTRAERPPVEASRPEAAPPAAAPVVAAPPPNPPPTAAASNDTSMGQVSNDLVPPSTEGLSPARRVNAIRIVMDGDREIRP